MKAITREEKIISGENLTPITRKEMFLAKASGQNIQTPTPITREEYFLSKITGGGGGTGGGGSVEGTAIPVGEKVENIYINYQLPYSEIKAYLSQLTYVDIGANFPMSFIYGQTDDGETGVFIFAVGIDGEYAVAICPSLDLNDAIFVCASGETRAEESLGTSQNIFLVRGANVIYQIKLIDLNATVLTEFMGLPVGAENEKIKNVLSITPFGVSGATSTNQPTAYTVSSVDELPSDAVDGSVAIVENNGLLGAWKLREYYDPADILYGTFYFDFYQHLLDEDEGLYGFRYDAIEVKNVGYPYISFLFEGERLADGIYDDGIAPPHNFITILKEPTDANAINFINTYLIRIGSGKGIYIRENGKWVYKCEVA